MAIVFEEQELYGFGFNETYGVYMLNSNHCSYTLEKGMQYLVTWDGIVYECVAQDMSAMQEGALVLGNMTSFGGTGNDEPFIIGWSELGETYMSFESAISHTLAIEKIEEAEEKAGADIVLYDRTGTAVKYENVETITTDTPDAEQGATFTYGVAVENAEYEPDFANGNQKVTLEKGQLLKGFTMVKPENLLPEYIKKNVEVAGVIGEFAGDEMEKTVELAMADGDQVIEADEDTVLTKVTVRKPETMIPENIVKGANIGGVIGTHTGEFGIYADGGNGREWIEPSRIVPYMFYNNSTLTQESFPNVSEIGSYAFYYAKINTIDLPLCEQISSNAFYGCTSLKTFTAPLCTNLGIYAFTGCSALEEASMNCYRIESATFSGCTKMKVASFPECSLIASSAFAYCSSLETLYAPKCSTLYAYVFRNCSNLCNLTLGAAKIGSNMVSGIAENKLLTISGEVVFSSSAFSSCKMSGLHLCGNGTVYNNAFAYCSNLKQVYNENELVGNYQFLYCRSLKRVVSPNLKQIATGAFKGCVTLACYSGKYANYINNEAFFDCSKLSVIAFTSYMALTKSIGTNAFANTPFENSTYLGYYGSIYVPESYLASYLADSYWASYAERFAPLTSEILALCEWEDL